MLKNKTLSWIGIILITVIFLIFKEEWSWSTKYPKEFILPFSDWINFFMEKFVSKFGLVFLKCFLGFEFTYKRCAMALTQFALDSSNFFSHPRSLFVCR